MEENKKYKILIVDDSEMNRSILSDILEEKFEILEAEDGVVAISKIRQYKSEISLILLDLVMPNMDGLEVLALMNRNDWIDDIPVIMISSENSPAYIERAYELGVTDFINRPFNVFVVRKRVANTIMLYAKQKNLVNLVNQQIFERVKNNDMMLNILGHIVEFRNGESGLHILHVNTITEVLLKQLMQKTDKYMLSTEDIETIVIASSLHDIGKMSIPDEILNKPGRLTKEEFEIMKGHAKAGADMLDAMSEYSDEPLVIFARDICLYHHERYDGTGYPFGLKGDEIPIYAQVVAIADVYDALTSARCYKPPYSHSQAIRMIYNGECGVFNNMLLECLADIEEILEKNLNVKSTKKKTSLQIKTKIDEILRQKQFSIANSSLNHLEQERIKNEFFASLSQEIQFELNFFPQILTLSEFSANKFGLAQEIMNPYTDEKLLFILNGKKTLDLFFKEMKKTDVHNPIAQFMIKMNVDGELRHHRVYCRVNWSNDDESVMLSAIGKIIDIEEEFKRIESLKKTASIDTLTNIHNRGYAESVIKEMLSSNKSKSFAMLLFDVDNFKTANDTFGHLFGDEVLKRIAATLKKFVDNDKVISRIGGDEFLMFVRYNTYDELLELVTKVEDEISEIECEKFDVQLSVGVATTDDAGHKYNNLFNCADSALYHAKRNGKGKAVFYNKTMELNNVKMTPIEN